jgi:hypothetical protein
VHVVRIACCPAVVVAQTCRDDGSRLALHWSAELGLVQVSQLLLKETAAAAVQLRQQMEAAGETADSFAPLNVLQIQVREGGRQLTAVGRQLVWHKQLQHLDKQSWYCPQDGWQG